MDWRTLCERPDLQNLPFKIELDAHGKIIMSPAKVYHSALQGEIAALLRLHRKDGIILTECAIATTKGTKVSDISWAAKHTYNIIKDEDECSVAPELCIEVLSISNTVEELQEKKLLYFGAGAKEFWLCEQNGDIEFFNAQGAMRQSILFPEFPHKIVLID